MKYLYLLLALALTATAGPTLYKMKGGERVAFTAQEQAAYEAKSEADAITREAAATKEATRLTKRPKRSQINSAKATTDNAKTVPELRAAVIELMILLENVLDYQKVDIDEDE